MCFAPDDTHPCSHADVANQGYDIIESALTRSKPSRLQDSGREHLAAAEPAPTAICLSSSDHTRWEVRQGGN